MSRAHAKNTAKKQSSWARKGPAKSKPRPKARAKRLGAGDEDRGRQVVRLLTMLRTLENTRRGRTVKQLREDLGEDCTIRTIYRSIDHLRQAGFQITDEKGVYRLAEGGGLRSEPLRADEIFALLLSEALWQPLGVAGPNKVLSSLHARLRAALKPEGRAWLEQLSNYVRASVLAPTLLQEKGHILDAIDFAVREEQLLELTYTTPNKGTSTRTVEPHLLWLVPGRAYLSAYCDGGTEAQTFAVQRISTATVLETTFERRADFDPREFTQRGFGVYHGETFDFSVRFTPSVAHLAHERAWHITQELTELSDGSVELTFRCAGLPEVAAWLAGFGGKVVALEPPELVDAVRALHEAGLEACRTRSRVELSSSSQA